MKRFLRAFLNWLDRKFPDKVVITLAAYNHFGMTISAMSETMLKHEERIKALESQMANTQLALGFTAPKLGMLER